MRKIITIILAFACSNALALKRNNNVSSRAWMYIDPMIKELERKHKLSPRNPEILYDLAGAYLTRSFSKVAQVYRNSPKEYIRGAPHNGWDYVPWSGPLVKNEFLIKAKNHFKMGSKLKESKIKHLFLADLAWIYLKEGNTQKAIDYYRLITQSKRVKPKYADISHCMRSRRNHGLKKCAKRDIPIIYREYLINLLDKKKDKKEIEELQEQIKLIKKHFSIESYNKY